MQVEFAATTLNFEPNSSSFKPLVNFSKRYIYGCCTAFVAISAEGNVSVITLVVTIGKDY